MFGFIWWLYLAQAHAQEGTWPVCVEGASPGPGGPGHKVQDLYFSGYVTGQEPREYFKFPRSHRDYPFHK